MTLLYLAAALCAFWMGGWCIDYGEQIDTPAGSGWLFLGLALVFFGLCGLLGCAAKLFGGGP